MPGPNGLRPGLHARRGASVNLGGRADSNPFASLRDGPGSLPGRLRRPTPARVLARPQSRLFCNVDGIDLRVDERMVLR
jgi:hypothetical protein